MVYNRIFLYIINNYLWLNMVNNKEKCTECFCYYNPTAKEQCPYCGSSIE